MILPLLIAALQMTSVVVMSPGGSNDRMMSEAFRGEPADATLLLAEANAAPALEVALAGGGKAQLFQGTDTSGRRALLLVPVPGTPARQDMACRVTEIQPNGADNQSRAMQWCRNVLGAAMIVRGN